MQPMKSLWHHAFGDTTKYIRYYFDKKAPRSRVYADYNDVELVSMMFFTPYEVYYKGKIITAEYIVGVATEEKYRYQGKMTKLMKDALEMENDRQIDLVFLCPENPKVYERLGFVPTYWRETLYYKAQEEKANPKTFQARAWKELVGGERKSVCNFIEAMFAREEFEAYICHTQEYMDSVNEELEALDGEILVIKNKGQIVAVANVILEENLHQITELICQPDYASEVLETILHRRMAKELIVEDSYFLDALEGENVRRLKQKKPYIMARYTDGRPMEPFFCYINDIT